MLDNAFTTGWEPKWFQGFKKEKRTLIMAKYSEEFKASVLAKIDHYRASGKEECISTVAREFEVSHTTVGRWVERAKQKRNSLITTASDDIIEHLRKQKKDLLRVEVQNTALATMGLLDIGIAKLYRQLLDEKTSIDETIKIVRLLTTIYGVSLDKVAKLEESAAGAKDQADLKPDSSRFFDRAYPRSEKATA